MTIASVRTTFYSAMAVSTCHLLLLLVPVLSLCGATEYYVRPTEPSSTPCPGYPCYTLSEYIGNSDSYFQSNTTFKFLPGTHYMDKPLIIGGENNISLESYSDEQPQLVAEFPCEYGLSNYQQITCGIEYIKVYCAAVQLRDMNHVTLKGINITVQARGLSGLVLVDVSNSIVQDVSSHYLLHYPAPVGILINNSQSIVVHSLSAFNYQYGIVFVETTHINISKIRAIDNKQVGFSLCSSSSITITNTTSSHNGRNGIYLYLLNNTHITNTTSSHNGGAGTYLDNSNNVHITDTTTAHNGGHGLSLYDSHNNTIISTRTKNNRNYGILIHRSHQNIVTNTTTKHNAGTGLYLYISNQNNVSYTTAMKNMREGLDLYVSYQNYFSYTTVMKNMGGLSLYYADQNIFTNTNIIMNIGDGLSLSRSQGNNFTNTISMCNKRGQISSYFARTNSFTNTIEIRNGGIGIFDGSTMININSVNKRCFLN